MRFLSLLRSLAPLITAVAATLPAALPAAAQTVPYPPAPLVKLAVNPVTNKVYALNEFANTVTVRNAATGATSTIAVGPRPQFIGVNPVTNRIYVNNAGDATLTIIDGATDANLTPTPLAIGSTGPITVNPATNVIYIVRLSGPGTDEVTYLDGNTNTWYTIATESFQPTAMAVNPLTDTIYVAHYGTGDVRVISGAFANIDYPATTSIGAWSRPFAIAANPVTNKAYVITEDSRGPIGIIDGATRTAVFPLPTSGHAQQPKSIAVNPVTNRIYAAFANEVIVIDGSTNAYTYIPIPGAGSGPMELGINYVTNKIYVATSNGTLTVIDGDTNTAAAPLTIAAGTSSVGVNPITNQTYLFDSALTSVSGGAGDTVHAIPLTTTITPFPGNTTTPSTTVTFNAASTFSPNAPPPLKVYYQLDSRDGPWTAATGNGPYSASFTGLAPGPHTLHAFATDGQNATLASGAQGIPLTGAIAAYAFTVSGAAASSISSPANNSKLAGSSQTFQWNDGGATLYQVWVGNTPGAYDLGYYPERGTTGTSVTITGLPMDGRKLYVRLWSLVNGAYQSRDFTYTAAGTATVPTPSSITSPANGSTLGGASQLFQWNDGGAGLYQLWVGNSPGSYDIGYFPRAGTTTTSTTATGLPTDGRTLYVRLYSNINGTYYYRDFVYTAAAGAQPAAIASPANGSTLSGSSQLLQWNDAGASLYQVWVGNSPGAYDIGYYPERGTTGTSTTVTGLPTDGRVLYVRLWSNIGGTYYSRDFTYRAGP